MSLWVLGCLGVNGERRMVGCLWIDLALLYLKIPHAPPRHGHPQAVSNALEKVFFLCFLWVSGCEELWRSKREDRLRGRIRPIFFSDFIPLMNWIPSPSLIKRGVWVCSIKWCEIESHVGSTPSNQEENSAIAYMSVPDMGTRRICAFKSRSRFSFHCPSHLLTPGATKRTKLVATGWEFALWLGSTAASLLLLQWVLPCE